MKILITFMLLFMLSINVYSEPRYMDGVKPDNMEEFALWGLTSRWILEDNKWRLCFFYMRRFVTCTEVPERG